MTAWDDRQQRGAHESTVGELIQKCCKNKPSHFFADEMNKVTKIDIRDAGRPFKFPILWCGGTK